jgi:hypothetical protein
VSQQVCEVSRDQFYDGYLELLGSVVYRRRFTLVGWTPRGTAIVQRPTAEEDASIVLDRQEDSIGLLVYRRRIMSDIQPEQGATEIVQQAGNELVSAAGALANLAIDGGQQVAGVALGAISDAMRHLADLAAALSSKV